MPIETHIHVHMEEHCTVEECSEYVSLSCSQIGAEDSAVYQVIGAALVLVFFLVRVANTPLTLLLYAAQHHHWSLYRALSAMRLICHSMLVAELTLQLHWFSQILSVASRVHLKPS